ncbi:E3 ubiquitin-protein ligase huwe1 [Bulinus truncatus]|nr:E3 ubiquitin-protein ligase huwe1 [Bulinus truncatus]
MSSAKRSNFISRMSLEKKQGLVLRLIHLAESWGGKKMVLGLLNVAKIFQLGAHYLRSTFQDWQDALTDNGGILDAYDVPQDKQVLLFTHVRLACLFSNYEARVQCVQARLQAISILVYSSAIQDNMNVILYPGLIEELVDIVEIKDSALVDIKSAALRTLTSVIHIERNPRLNSIIGTADFFISWIFACVGANMYPAYDCYDNGVEALVSCGMMESLLQHEVNICRKERPFVIRPQGRETNMETFIDSPSAGTMDTSLTEEGIDCDTVGSGVTTVVNENTCSSQNNAESSKSIDNTCIKGKHCFARAALLKSMLNLMKKAIPDLSFAESIRHSTDVVTVYVFQEPSLLSSLQDKGLTDVVLQALLIKDVPATREVLASLPNVFSAHVSMLVVWKLLWLVNLLMPFKVLLSPDYLPAMRRRRSSDTFGIFFSRNCLRQTRVYLSQLVLDLHSRDEASSSDEEEDEETEMPHMPPSITASTHINTSQVKQAVSSTSNQDSMQTHERQAIPLMDYVLNVMKFVEAILSNNSTDDHCKEFVAQNGLKPLMSICRLPNLPIDFPSSTACQAVSSACKSV